MYVQNGVINKNIAYTIINIVPIIGNYGPKNIYIDDK